jgi:hypothetical protein
LAKHSTIQVLLNGWASDVFVLLTTLANNYCLCLPSSLVY